jgi:hypothetical protein
MHPGFYTFYSARLRLFCALLVLSMEMFFPAVCIGGGKYRSALQSVLDSSVTEMTYQIPKPDYQGLGPGYIPNFNLGYEKVKVPNYPVQRDITGKLAEGYRAAASVVDFFNTTAGVEGQYPTYSKQQELQGILTTLGLQRPGQSATADGGHDNGSATAKGGNEFAEIQKMVQADSADFYKDLSKNADSQSKEMTQRIKEGQRAVEQAQQEQNYARQMAQQMGQGGGAGGGAGAGAGSGAGGDSKGGDSGSGGSGSSSDSSSTPTTDSLSKLAGLSNSKGFDPASILGSGNVEPYKFKPTDLSNLVTPNTVSSGAARGVASLENPVPVKDSNSGNSGELKIGGASSLGNALTFKGGPTGKGMADGSAANPGNGNVPNGGKGNASSADNGDPYPDNGEVKFDPYTKPNFEQGNVFGGEGGSTEGGATASAPGGEDMNEGGDAPPKLPTVSRTLADDLASVPDGEAKEPGIFGIRNHICGTGLRNCVKLHPGGKTPGRQTVALEKTRT